MAALLMASTAATAQADELWYGYGDGTNYSADNVWGSSSKSVLTAAIKIPASQTANFVGARITGIRFATAKAVSTTTCFVSNSISTKEYNVTIGATEPGWHEYTFETPYQITEACDLYIGYTTKGATYTIPIETGGGCEGSCVLGQGTSYADYYKDKGFDNTVNVRACIVTDGAMAPALGLSPLTDVKWDTNSEYTFEGTITLANNTPVTSYTLSTLVDGASVASTTFEASLNKQGDAVKYSLTLPILSAGMHTYGVTITDINGEPAAATISQTANISIGAKTFVRRQVVEECTGTWCGYCVRGIVGMTTMRQNHPDTFIGIAVHTSDVYQTSTYNALLNRISGVPSAFINRSTSFDPSPSLMESYYKAEAETAEAQVTITEARFTEDYKKLVIKTTSEFTYAHTGSEAYRLAFVILEDSVEAVQTNYYSGGAMGVMGGFEKQGSYVSVQLMDIARCIQSYSGIAGSVPTELVPFEKYEYEYTFTLPTNIADRAHLSVVAMLQDTTGSYIYNADKCETLLEPETAALTTVTDDATSTGRCYDLQGRQITQPVAGQLFISNGRKAVMR